MSLSKPESFPRDHSINSEIRNLFFLFAVPLFHTPQYHPEGGTYGYFSAKMADGRVGQYSPVSEENLEVVHAAVERHRDDHKAKGGAIKNSNRGLPILIQETARDHY